MIAIIDYGSGNVAAIANIFKQAKIPHAVTSDRDTLVSADRYILPGVGAFDTAMNDLTATGTVDILNEQVIGRGKNLLGICVGMQLLAETSDEGERAGFGWIRGQVRRIDTARITQPPHLPHMGWNSVDICSVGPLMEGVDAERGFYFLHSYYFDAENPANVVAKVMHGTDLPCVVARNNVMGVQFHPEKSHENGVRLLRNFADMH